ncbi:DNA-directed RNA polymerase subunit H [Candidatus Woesearchaeota archaeon CG10_big_fil_rev_8_21_14_0_10_45_16]|nr:MAG: DNA-directed RNA polymerase subunit H [Candidatus Woesearchaeota archaeon CG10_big_fil_rev_8_21_14_0_10_45_16]
MTSPAKHILVPSHVKLSDKEKETFLQSQNLTIKELPKILVNDPALIGSGAKEGDIIRIERASATAGKTFYYRVVING